MTNVTITCLNGGTVSVRVVRLYLKGRLCYDCVKKKFYVVDNKEDVEIDMDLVELTYHIKKFIEYA